MNARILLAISLLLAAPVAGAQQPGSAPDASKQMHEVRFDRGHEDMPKHGEMGGHDLFHKGHGEFWKSPEIVTRLALTPDQVKRLDDLTLKSEIDSIHLRAALDEDQVMLKPLLEGPAFDEHKVDAQIDKIAEARAALEKERMKSLFGIRGVLTADQWTKLHSHEGMERHGIGEGRGEGHGDWGKRGPRPGGSPPSAAPTQE